MMLDALLFVPAMAAAACLAQSQPAPPPTVPLVLMPARFEAGAGEQLPVSLESIAGAPVAWGSRGVTWFFVRVAGTQENRDAVPGVAGAGGGAAGGGPITIPLDHAGVTMIGVDFAPIVTQFAPDKLREILDDAVAPSERDRLMKELPADKPIRVRSVHSAKSLVRVLPPVPPGSPVPFAPDAQTTVSKSGQVSEVRPTLDPLESLVGGDISVRLHADFEKAAGARATATNLDSGKTQEFFTDSNGIGVFHLDEAGRWRLAFTTARRLAGDATADVILYSATLTFAATRTEVPK